MSKKLYWLDKKSTFGAGKNCVKFGDELKDGQIDAGRLAKFVKAGMVGEKAAEVVSGDNKIIIELKGEIAELGKKLKKKIEKVSGECELCKEKDSEIEKLNIALKEIPESDKDKEIEFLKSNLGKKDLKKIIVEKDDKIKELEGEIEELLNSDSKEDDIPVPGEDQK